MQDTAPSAELERHVAARGDFRNAGLLLVVLLVLFATIGILSERTGSPALDLFDLDRELGVAALVSGALLLAAGLLIAGAHRESGARLPQYALPLLLAFMAADEFAFLHERLEERTGVDWQILYSPLILAGGVAWALVLRRWGPRSIRGQLLLAGAAAWGVSQILEKVQWGPGDVPVPAYPTYMLGEEVLEAAGSACFLLAGLLALLLGRAVARSGTGSDGDQRRGSYGPAGEEYVRPQR